MPVCDWVAGASRELQGQRDLMEAFNACVNGADVQIVVKLRHGVIELQGIKEDKCKPRSASRRAVATI
jgi:hypothetical protein